ncbi:TetR family transcriptional regulator [Rhodobacteraceae bacterium CY05]|uniref:TetR family transcriptional regulator n=1 Tax=Parasedimentitalea huanghaiensis TaxID=2682100 RepID=A0A6L6WFC6_9RHOB|nr:TetR family transcriptional regulator [Zongyanglinia huanghaiensis]
MRRYRAIESAGFESENRVPKKIASKDAWVKLGFRKFCVGGVDALRVEAMGRTLGVSKASFYHFFKTRDVFINDIINHWRDLRTEEYIVLSQAKSDTSLEINTLILTIFSAEIEDDFLIHLRRLGQANGAVRDLLIEVEKQRIDYACSSIERLGYSHEVAQEKATIIYNYYLGWRERQKTTLGPTRTPAEELTLLVEHLGLCPQ